jgi:peptide/nickel transport system permease protein
VFDRLPNTVFLVLGAAVVWFLSGVLIGIVSAVARGSIWDRLLMGGALVAISAPVYWLGLVCLYLFSSDIGVLHIFPGAGAYQDAHSFFAKVQALIMPWVVLSAAFAAIYARLLRSNLLETLSEDYIRTARAKGLSERRVVFRHGVRSAITPIVTVLGLDIGILMGGALLTETVFNIDGIGRLAYDAIQRGDLATIQGTTLVLACAVALMSLVVDVLYAFLDPRVRY